MPGIYLSFEREIADVDATKIDWRALSQATDSLDEIALAVGLAPLMGFFSIAGDEAQDFLEQHGASDAVPADQTWFAAADGLKTVRGLLAALELADDAIAAQEQVIEELEEFENILEILQTVGVRFRLSADA